MNKRTKAELKWLYEFWGVRAVFHELLYMLVCWNVDRHIKHAEKWNKRHKKFADYQIEYLKTH